MARKTARKPIGTAASVVLGAVVGLLVAAWATAPVPGAPPAPGQGLAGWGMAAGAVLGYLLACARYPWGSCPRCSGGTTDRDGEGHVRVRRACWVCGGQRWPRPGTRLLRVLGWQPRG